MERQVLKEQIKELIGNQRVKAAIFYTFNFDPYFFENYVMPLLVPEKNFRDEAIYNNIMWRHCAREGVIPPVTIYCDHYAKDNTMAPTLGYEVRCVRLQGKKYSIVNFHPKECWILLSNNELLQINSSANLTPSGWCDNLECVSVKRHFKNSFPKTVTLNTRQRMMQGICKLTAEQVFSESEQKIHDFLRYTDESADHFSSLQTAFLQKISEIIGHYRPDRIEIVSPYMYGEAVLIEHLHRLGITEIYCLVPSLKTSEVLLTKETFLAMRDKGISWSGWKNRAISHEVRNLHAKIYRLYGKEKTITITGSVNFTGPAWGKCSGDILNEANVESAIVHVENRSDYWLERLDNLDPDQMLFMAREDVNTTEMTGLASRNAPAITFTLNWKTKQLASIGKLQAGQHVKFKNLLLERELTKDRDNFDLQPADLKHLTKNALIELVDVADATQIFAYYPCQLEIESRPLNFKLNPDTILNFWLSGGDPYVEEELSGQVAAQVTDESGMIDVDKFLPPSLLNEMARHFAALIKLEETLFDKPNSDRMEQFHALRYYLLTENLDTIPFYINGINDLADQEKISSSFCWMIHQILITRFYERALSWPHKKMTGRQWQNFKNLCTEKRAGLLASSTDIATSIRGLKEKAHWITTQLSYNHA